MKHLLLLLPFVLAGGPTANELNTEGFRLYKLGEIVGAKEKFEAAIDIDQGHALAHYNLACMLALLRSKGPGSVCEHDAYKGTIVEHLKTAVRLDERRRARLKVDSDLDSVHDTFGYQLLTGLSLGKTADVKEILTSVSWYGPAPGAYGPMSKARFEADGSVEISLQGFDEDANVTFRPIRGTYTVKANSVSIKLSQPIDNKKTFTATLTRDGGLDFGPTELEFTDDADECSA